MTLQYLARLVALGEGAGLEFKRKVPRPARLAKEIIAFANTRGGRILIGVDDDGTIRGVRDVGEEEFALAEVLDRCIVPHIDVSLTRVEVTRRRDVLLLDVPESADKPHYLTGEDGRKVAYVRIDDMSVEASREHLRLMKASKSQRDVRFEFGEKELMLIRYLEQYGQITVTQFASLADIPKRNASRTLVLLARANVLTLHAHPRQDYFTLAYSLPG